MGETGPRERLMAEILDLEPALFRAMGPSRAKDWLDVDLTMSQLKMLFVIHGMPGPDGRQGLRVSEVARFLGVTLPTVTAVMDKLVERGLVRRDEDPLDRRQHVCRLTPAGSELLDRLMAGHRAQTTSLLSYLNDEELAIWLRAMQLLIGAAQRLRAEAPTDQAAVQSPTRRGTIPSPPRGARSPLPLGEA